MNAGSRLGIGLIAALEVACGAFARERVSFKPMPGSGVRAYRYTSLERGPGQPDRGYRVDFDLATDGRHGVVAIVHRAEQRIGEGWTSAAVDAACAAALHARRGELARVVLMPLSPMAAASLGEPFMASCAPAALFFPMTDILNVTLIQTSPSFAIRNLHEVGDSSRFAGFRTQLDRLGEAIEASSPGGRITLSALDATRAVVDWAPDPMRVAIAHHGAPGQPDIVLRGTEYYAFRLEIDRSTGVLLRATTPHDYLDLVVDVPDLDAQHAPHLRIVRDVRIEQLSNVN